MDGGRILRGALARKLGIVRATRIAARLGRLFAVLFAVLGFLGPNVLLLLVSFIVYVGAEAEARAVLLREALGGLRVRDLMSPLEAAVGGDERLLAVAERMSRERRTAYPVSESGRVVGFVTADAIARVPPGARGETAAREVLRPAAVAEAGDRIADALHLFGEAGFPEIAVTDGGRVVGTLSQLDVARGLELRDLAHPGREAGTRSAT
jgi:predicted transcriptional regulator